MPRTLNPAMDAEDIARLLVKERERKRLLVLAMLFMALAGAAVAMTLMYLNPY